MDEKFISGYCRALDAARTVTAEKDGDQWIQDCAFGACPHEGSCPIAKELERLRLEH